MITDFHNSVTFNVKYLLTFNNLPANMRVLSDMLYFFGKQKSKLDISKSRMYNVRIKKGNPWLMAVLTEMNGIT